MFAVQGDSKSPCCYYCKKPGHLLEKCYSFRNEKFEARKEFVRKEKLCDVCFGKDHFAKHCKRRDKCLVVECSRWHHSFLHPVQSSVKEEPQEDAEKGPNAYKEENGVQCTATGAGRPGVRLRVIPVKVRGIDRTQEIETYALLDDGSDVSLCNIDLVKQLGITGVPTRFSLTTVNDGTRQKIGEEVRLIVSDLKGQEEIDITRAWTVDKLPISRRSIPTASDVARWSNFDGIEFPELSNETVGIIIGSDVPEAHWVLDQRRGGRKEPYAI